MQHQGFSKDAFDIAREKYITLLTGYKESDLQDVDIRIKIRLIRSIAQERWETMTLGAERGIFSTFPDVIKNGYRIKDTYACIKDMAIAYRTPGSSLYLNAALAKDIIAGLDWMNQKAYREGFSVIGNWWEWEIGIPALLNDITVLMYDALSEEQINHYMKAVNWFNRTYDYFNPDWPETTGANRVWKCKNIALAGIITRNAARIMEARDGISPVLPYVTIGDGFYEDGSFLQHAELVDGKPVGGHPYVGGYGYNLLADLTEVTYILKDTPWEITDPNIGNLYRWIYDTFDPFMYKGGMMEMVKGRTLSRCDERAHHVGPVVINAVLMASLTAPDEKDRSSFRSMAKQWILDSNVWNCYIQFGTLERIRLVKEVLNDSSVQPRGELAGHCQFPGMDRVVHRRSWFAFGISMFSSRIFNFESINDENIQGWYTGDGMTYLYTANDPGQYSLYFWPTVDRYRLPGITMDTRRRKNADNRCRWANGENWLSSKSWVGGTVMSREYGIAGMELESWQATLTARKSWFMFDDEIVAMGTDIRSSDGRTIETIIDNRNLSPSGNYPVTVNGVLKPSDPGWQEVLEQISWIHLEGTGGYYFPGNDRVHVLRERRKGTWGDIGTGDKETVYTRDYLTLWFDHGINPSNAAYAYVLLPGKNAAQVQEYAETPDVTIIEQSAAAHAVRQNRLNLLGVNFWEDAVVTVDCVTCDKKAAVMIREIDEEIWVSVSDPTQENDGSIRLIISLQAERVITADARMHISSLSPVIELSVEMKAARGRSCEAVFRKNQV